MREDKKQQMQTATSTPSEEPTELSPSFWVTAAVGALALGVLYAALPEKVTIGPSWLPLVLVIIVLLPFLLASLLHRPLPHITHRLLGFALLGIGTLALTTSVILLVITLPSRTQLQAAGLLRTAGLLWLVNILVFALWYWEIDGGGPLKRHRAGHLPADLMFPQQSAENKRPRGWEPRFLDYLFVAFTGATALSPTDTYPLTRRAKALMMLEALISMSILVLLAARAVNIL